MAVKSNNPQAQTHFERAEFVAASIGFEYAIDLYLQGLAIDSDNVEAHQALRELSLRRKAGGRRALNLIERIRLAKHTNDLHAMLNAEKMLAYDPGSYDRMLAFARAAGTAGMKRTAEWIETIVTKAMRP